MVESWPARLVGEGTSAVARPGTKARTAVNDGSELLIFVPRAAHGHDLSSQFVAARQARARSETAPRIGPNARKSAL